MIVDLFMKVLNLSIGAVPLMAVLLVLRLLFKKAVPRKVFYIAWALVFIRLMIPFSLESDFSFFNYVPEVQVSEENVGTSIEFVRDEGEKIDFPVLTHENPNVDSPERPTENIGQASAPPKVTTAPTDKNFIFGTIWVFGTAALLLFGIGGYFAVLKKIRFESVAYTDKIRLSEFFRTPVVCGLFRPKIILPMNFDLDDDAKIHSVISHECTHICRGDNFWRLLATFTLYVHWFNPLVWICYNAFIRDMEVSCDEAVLSGAKNDIRGEYAESLVALAGSGMNPLYGGVLSFGECAIKERVKCIMNFKKTTVLIIILCVAAAIALGVIFLTNPSAGQEPSEYYEVEMEKSEALIFDKEKGVDVSVHIRNISDIPIYIYPEIELYFYDDYNWIFFGNYYPSEGTVVLNPKTEGVLCGNLGPELFEGVPEISGKYKIRRQISKDAGNSQLIDFVEYIFEIKATTEAIPAEQFYGRVMEGSHLGSFIPDQSNMPTEDIFDDPNQKKYCEKLIDEIKPETVERFYVTFSPNDETTYREIEYSYMEDILFLLQNMELTVCEMKNPNTGGLTSIYFQTTAGNITIQNNGGFFTIAKENDSVRYAFDAEPCASVFDDIESIARGIMSGEYDEGETNPAIGYDFYGAIYAGEAPEGKYIPKASVLPQKVVWADEQQKKYCEDLIDSVDLGKASAFVVGSYDDENTRVGISKTQANNLLGILKDTELVVSEPTNPNMPVPEEIHIVMNSGDYIKIVWDTSYFTLYRKGDEAAYRFDASQMKEYFIKFSNLANDYFIYGAGTGAQYPDNPDMEHLIPENTETITTLFNNNDKFAAESYIGSELRDLLKYENFESVINSEEANASFLGNPLTKVSGVEFARTEDGKKYTLTLYEKGFVLSGSASGKLNGAIVTVEENAWDYFVNIVNKEFYVLTKVPYWFGLVSPKRVKEVVVFGANGEQYSYTQKDDAFDNFFAILRHDIKVSSLENRFNGNKITEKPSGDYIRLKIYFETGTVYEILAERDYITMVSSDMNYGLRYALTEKADAYDAFLDYAEGGPINAVTG